MRYLSLFSGIGGFELALERTFGQDALHCSGYCEIDDAPASVYSNRFNGHLRTKDVRDVKAHPNLDLLVAGFPCTDLSIARRSRNGLAGEYSGLFYELLRILDESRPQYFIIENVASMPEHERDLITIRLGVSPVLLDAADVSFQQRKRLFWTNFPLRQPAPIDLPDFDTVLEPNPAKHWDLTVREREFMHNISGTAGKKPCDKGYIHDTVKAKSQCITANIAKGVPSNVLIDRRFDPPRWRKVTPLECERLMGFPDYWTLWGKGKILTDAKRWRMVGNSVSVPVVTHVIQSLKDYMLQMGQSNQ